MTYLPGVVVSNNSALTAGTNANLPAYRFPLGFNGFASATADGIADYDLRGQYTISRINLDFNGTANWANGGKVQIAALPGQWTTVADSGRGSPFPAPTPSGAFSIDLPGPTPARYVRVTDYFVAGSGTSSGRLDGIEVFP